MKIKKLILLIACLWPMQLLADNLISKTNSSYERSEFEQEIKTLLNSLREITKVPGYSVAVVHQGITVASVATGYTDTDKNLKTNEESIFRLASVSKVIGATMLAELVVDGKLNPDIAIGQYMPELDKHYHKITLRQLLSHTSGMPHYQAKDYDIYNKHYSAASEAISTLKSRDLLEEPGKAYHYSTHAYTLAGALYEKITDQPLSVTIPNFIKRWTGKDTPAIENILNLAPNTSQLYSYSFGKIKQEEFGEKSYSVFGAGLSSTALDLAHLGYQVLNKSKTNPAYQSLLFSPTLTTSGNIVSTPKFQVGFGWRIGDDMQARKVYHHAGATPGARSVLVLYPEHGLSISILSNTSWVSGIDKMAYSIAGLYLDVAKPITLQTNTKYNASFGGTVAAGKVFCTDDETSSNCFIKDENTAFTKWQNKFNSTSEFTNDWPIYAYTSSTGNRLLLVSKTGINTLLSDGTSYKLLIGKDKSYSLKFID
ncbi:serine hydrolase domain-containing protein [Psychrosphaera haliotis]|uniref:Serine hydrolase n=1 Tax=Psychrosphaera haliotis TaxID=555083 RepID=A0A6N8FAU7_9GAMM|nr:serine hydrolase domain-containing protein [Psychrosphaera haliotis]MUH72267.1 serine hydrolase [Psychrosphaera haliotis]